MSKVPPNGDLPRRNQSATVDVGILLAAEASLFSNCKAVRPDRNLSLGSFLTSVKKGQWQAEVEQIRNAHKIDPKRANQLKIELLPVVKVSGTFSGSKAADLLRHSGVLCLDFDHVGEWFASLRNSLSSDPHVLAHFRSPRGNGLKAFVAIDASNADEHERCVEVAYAHFRGMTHDGIGLDPAPSNISANCLASWDPDLWEAASPREILSFAGCLGVETRGRETISEVSEESVTSEVSVVSMSQEERPGTTRAGAEQKLVGMRTDRPHLAVIFDKFLSRRPVRRGQRFSLLRKAVPSLFSVVAPDVLVELLLLHYDLNRGIWNTSREDHRREILSMISAYGKDYAQKLSVAERPHYEAIGAEAPLAAFRICRDLAKKSGSFFLGYACLGQRLGIHRQQAQRIMTGLYADGVIDLVEPGLVWGDGRRPTATSWKWILNRPSRVTCPPRLEGQNESPGQV